MRGFLGAQNSHRYNKFEAQTLTTGQTSLTARLIGAATVTRSFSAFAPLPAATHFGHTILRACAHAIGMVYAKGREPCFAQSRSVSDAFVKSEESSLTVVFGCQDHKARFLSLLTFNTLENSHTNLARVAVTAHFKLRGKGEARGRPA